MSKPMPPRLPKCCWQSKSCKGYTHTTCLCSYYGVFTSVIPEVEEIFWTYFIIIFTFNKLCQNQQEIQFHYSCNNVILIKINTTYNVRNKTPVVLSAPMP